MIIIPESNFNMAYSMIHEVLFALNGNIGSLFKTENLKIEVIEELPLAPGERTFINRILQVAGHYKKLKDFIDKNATYSTTVATDDGHLHWYFLAFCSGLDEVLEGYRNAITLLERTILADPNQALTHILGVTDEHSSLLQVLCFIVDQVETSNQLNGCRILELLHGHSRSVADNVEVAIKRIQQCCHKVLYKHLALWLIHGHLEDEDHQFFIQREPRIADSNDLAVIKETGARSSYAAFNEFKLCHELLPSYIPISMASEILYIGQTVVMIQRHPHTRPALEIGSDWKPLDIWNGKDADFLRQLQTLHSAETFQDEELKKVLDAIGLCVTQYMWWLAVNNAKFLDELQLVKDFFLLGRGELFLDLILQANELLSSPPTRSTIRDVNQMLRSAVRNVHMDEETIFAKFSLNIAEGQGTNGWDGLQLVYKVQWPLHLLFSDAAINNYNLLFRFLLRVRSTQSSLHALWKKQIENKSRESCDVNPDLWQLRRNLTFVMDNLQHYLQMDVIESQYKQFITLASNTDNFEEVKRAHSIFLASILSQSFLLTTSQNEACVVVKNVKVEPENQTSLSQNKVMNCLIALLDLSANFCTLASLHLARGTTTTLDQENLQTNLKDMEDVFVKQMGLLKQLLIGFRGHPNGIYLSQLLLRLDFNGWLSTHCLSIDDLV